MAACEPVLIQQPEALRGSWRSLMPGCRELRVEVGCGKGKFTVETAQAEPDVLLIAIEKVPDALVLAMEAAMQKGLHNVYFVSLDADRIEEFFDESEIDLLYINFCDPWPRGKNAKRRLTYRAFLEKYKTVLRLGGQIHFKTDNRKLFDWSLPEMEAARLEVRCVSYDLHANGPVGIMTGYEERFYALGTPINRCEAVVVTKQKGEAAEPCCEILRLCEHPRMLGQVQTWFSACWDGPQEALLQSMEDCARKTGALPQWYLAVIDGAPVGALAAVRTDGAQAQLAALFVEKGSRGQGLAGKLLHFACGDLKKRGIETLCVETENTALFERCGWQEGSRAGDSVYMQKYIQ